MELVDSHCHLHLLDLSSYGGDLRKVLQEANDLHVTAFLSVSVDIADYKVLEKIAESYPHVYISAGMHPNNEPGMEIDLPLLEKAAQHPKVIAIGETGLDYYRSEGDCQWQRERFDHHIQIAKKLKKPLIIHTREARKDTLDMLQHTQAKEVGGVMHCFTEDWETAKKALDLGFYISFSGIVTFKNAVELQEVAKKVPLSRILIETDCPYLAPIPYRGKQNVPGYVYYVVKFLAMLRNEPIEVLAAATTDNFHTLFKIEKS